MNHLRTRALTVVASLCGLFGCDGADVSDSRPERTSVASAPLLGGLLPPIVTCTAGIDLVNVAFIRLPTSWDDDVDFETSLRSALGNPAENPWFLQPRNLDYAWHAFPLPAGYSSSVTDLVAQYADVSPVNSRIAQCVTTTLLGNGGVVSSEPTTYVIWDPRMGGTGGGP